VEEDKITETKHLKVELENPEDPDVKYSYISPAAIGKSAAGELKVTLSDIVVASDISYFNFKKDTEKYAEYRLDMDTSITGSLVLETDEDGFKIPLGRPVYIPFEYGFVSLNIEFYLQMTAKGEFSITASLPTSICVRHDKYEGLRVLKCDVGNADFSSALEAEIMLSFNADAKLYVFFFWDIIGAGVKAGALGNASIEKRDNGMVCTDLSVAFPVVKGNMYINFILARADFDFDFLSAEDAPIKFGLHHEYVPGVRNGWVDECSYGNEELFNKLAEEAGKKTESTEEAPSTEKDTAEAPSTEETTEPVTEKTVEKAGTDISAFYGYPFGMEFDVDALQKDTQVNSEFGFNEGIVRFDITDTGSGYRMRGTLKVPFWLTPEDYEKFLNEKTLNYIGKTFTITAYESEHDEVNPDGSVTMVREGYTYIDENGKEGQFGNQYEPAFSKFDEAYYAIGEPIVIENVEILVPYDMVKFDIQPLLNENGINLAESVGMNFYTIWLDGNGNISRMELR
jgi:hypothetical protein